jgi:hypothetical protein
VGRGEPAVQGQRGVEDVREQNAWGARYPWPQG